jgi:hypothetical protein
MATGNKNSNFTINISSKEAEASIRRLKGEVEELESDLKKLDSTSSKYESTLKKLSTTQKLLNKEEDRYNSALKQTTVHHKNSINAIQQKISALRQEMNAMDMSSDTFKQRSADMRQLTASMLEGSSATGLHAASAMELGRVFSDAPYGIRGVANNMSQLASLLAQSARATDAATGKMIGFTGAVRGLFSALKGPLGILLAVQAVIAIFESFSNSTKEASEDVKELDFSLDQLYYKFNNLSSLLHSDVVNGIEGVGSALGALRNEFGELDKKIEDTEAALGRELSSEETKVIVDDYRELLKVRTDLKNALDAESKRQKEISEGTKRFSHAENIRARNNITDLLKRKSLLEDIFKIDSSNVNVKDFKEKNLDLRRFISDLEKEAELSLERNVVKRLNIEQKHAKGSLKLELDTFIEKEKIRRDNFIANAKSQEEIDDANETFNSEEIKAKKEYGKAVEALEVKQKVDTSELLRQIDEDFSIENQELRLERANSELEALSELIDSKDPKALAVLQDKQQEVWALEDEAFEKDRERRLKALTEQYNSVEMAESILSEEKLIRDSERAALEVQMEVDKIEAKKAVNLEYANWLSSLGSTFRALVKENEDLSRAALFVEKAGAVAKIVVNAQAANAETLLNASTEASSYQSAAAKTAASVGGGPQGFLAAAPYIAKAASAAAIGKSRIAKNNVGAGLSIAKIMATTLGSSSLSSSGGDSSSSGAPSFTPSFNVVGNSETNQLAESIGGQINEPTRAYVVYEDIQEAGNLEANAIEASGI